MTKSEVKNLEKRVADLDGKSKRSHLGEVYVEDGTLLQMLPVDLGNRLVQFMKRQRRQFGKVRSWMEFLRGLSDEEQIILAKAITQLESHIDPTAPTFKGMTINSTLAVETSMAMGAREYAKKIKALEGDRDNAGSAW